MQYLYRIIRCTLACSGDKRTSNVSGGQYVLNVVMVFSGKRIMRS